MIDFNIDEIDACCDSLIADGLEYLAPAGMNDSVKVKSFITRLRQAEKDAERYRELRDTESETCLEFINAKERMASPEWLDGLVDEYMKCNK